MVTTAKSHFDQDISRAKALLDHAKGMDDSILKDDILRSAWMYAVGACDAYFSDAYADLIARTLNAKQFQSSIIVPDRLNRLKLPALAFLDSDKGGWRWRMAARELIEQENVLSLDKIKSLFNGFFKSNEKILTQETIARWLLVKDAKVRCFGITQTEYRKLTGASIAKAKKDALAHFDKRFKTIFQRRHDCIHNCDRPKVALHNITVSNTEKCLEDVQFLVCQCDSAFRTGFNGYLSSIGANAITRNRFGL